MPTTKKPDTDEVEEESTEEEEPTSSTVDRSTIEQVVRDVLDDVLGGDDEPIEEPATEDKPLTLRDVEAAAAAAVRKEQQKIARKSGDGKASGTGRPAKPSPPPPEQPPATPNWWRKLVWGEE